MSPLSQRVPTTRDSTGAAVDDLEASAIVYSASYSAVRILSVNPPANDTYRLVRPPSRITSLIVPTSYRVTVPGPAIARPGSTTTAGTLSPAIRHSRLTISSSDLAINSGAGGSSSTV